MTDDIVEADEGKSQVVISCIDSKTQYRSLCQNKRIVFEPEFLWEAKAWRFGFLCSRHANIYVYDLLIISIGKDWIKNKL